MVLGIYFLNFITNKTRINKTWIIYTKKNTKLYAKIKRVYNFHFLLQGLLEI
jgi:hypothetical protein